MIAAMSQFPDQEFTVICLSSNDDIASWKIFRKYFCPDDGRWDPRFREDSGGGDGAPLIRFTPETVVMRDQSYRPPWRGTAM